MWVGENTAIPDNADSFSQFPLESHKLAAMTRLKESFIKDCNFNIEGYLRNEFARRFGRAEEAACIMGDGENQPCGLSIGHGFERTTLLNASIVKFAAGQGWSAHFLMATPR